MVVVVVEGVGEVVGEVEEVGEAEEVGEVEVEVGVVDTVQQLWHQT